MIVLLVENGHLTLVTRVLLVWAVGYYLIVKGRGILFPLDPTQRLVTTGPCPYLRNPQAIAMVLIVSGEIPAVYSHYLWLLLPLTPLYLEVLASPWMRVGGLR